MEIIHNDYQVKYDQASAAVICQGSLRLRGGEGYKPILQLLIEAADAKPQTLTLDLRGLRFLNSSGIITLSKFILHVRDLSSSQLVIQGSSQFPWQSKSLINLQRLLPALQLEIE